MLLHLDRQAYNALMKRFKLLGRKWARDLFNLQSVSQDDVDEVASYLMQAFVELDKEKRELLFAAGNEGKLYFHLKNLMPPSARQISVQASDDGEGLLEISDLRYAPEIVLHGQQFETTEAAKLLDQLAELQQLSTQACGLACGLKERESRNIKNDVYRAQVQQLLTAAARHAGISKRELAVLKSRFGVA
jgi:hypothetical protein